jgi:hypothetical protein
LYKYLGLDRLLAWLLHFFQPPRASDKGPDNNELPPTKTSQIAEDKKETNQDPVPQPAQELQYSEAVQSLSKDLEQLKEGLNPLNVQAEQKQEQSITEPCKQEVHQSNQNISSPNVCYKLSNSLNNTINRALRDEVLQQFAYAKKIGLEPTVMQFDSVSISNVPVGPRKKLSEQIAQQAEYAKSIGLVPVTPQAIKLNGEAH